MSSPKLVLNQTERVNRVRSDLSMGLPCILTHADNQALMVPLETVTETKFSALKELLGTPELVISANRARAVMTVAAAANLADGPVRICQPVGADFAWYQRLADPKFDQIGGVAGPLHVLRAGETTLQEAGLSLVKSVELIPAFALFPIANKDAALSDFPLMQITADEALAHMTAPPKLAPVASASLPLEAYNVSRLHVFRDPDGQREHYAIEIGNPDLSRPVLTRLHSACFTGDVLGSLKCDCGPQLQSALARMGKEGAGVLLYLNQEGRGIGLANKMRVYDLQDQGFDTVEANHQLGFEDDERDFRLAATLLNELGIKQIRLLTNNPGKVQTLADSGIDVIARLPLAVGRNAQNLRYLNVKARKSGHIFQR